MAKECILEFYFKSDQLLNMLNKHKGAKGIIVSQRIIAEKVNGKTMNVVHIKARVDKLKAVAKSKVSKAGKSMTSAAPGDDGFVDGCPYPPGCTV
jgi:hypothetical protein